MKKKLSMIMSKLAVNMVKFYQKIISPLKPSCCRFYPTCSQYAKGAFKKFGFFKGGVLALYRILRCNPFNKGGIDYIPEKFSWRYFIYLNKGG